MRISSLTPPGCAGTAATRGTNAYHSGKALDATGDRKGYEEEDKYGCKELAKSAAAECVDLTITTLQTTPPLIASNPRKMGIFNTVTTTTPTSIDREKVQELILPPPCLHETFECADAGPLWYDYWVREQIKRQPDVLFSALDGVVHDEKDIHQDRLSRDKAFLSLWMKVLTCCSSQDTPSLNNMIVTLEAEGAIRLSANEEEASYSQSLVMAIIGWQTMLFRPDLGSCPHSQLAIVDETDGYRTHAQICLKQDQFRCSSKLHVFLSGYGQLLPSASVPALSSDDDKLALRQFTTVAPAALNAYVLSTVGGITIRWTDSLACHMEFDRVSNTVWLFRYPGFCDLHLSGANANHRHRTTLHACAKPPNSRDYWASRDEVDEYLREVILSFRILFAQKGRARRFFETVDPFEHEDAAHRDPYLRLLCTRVDHVLDSTIRQRELYELSVDFPLLKEKMVVLLRHLSLRRPRTWRELWNDKRDSASWFTFWAVVIIGGLGILMAFLQLVLQTVQVVLATKSSN